MSRVRTITLFRHKTRTAIGFGALALICGSFPPSSVSADTGTPKAFTRAVQSAKHLRKTPSTAVLTKRQELKINAFQRKHPLDIAGLGRLTKKFTGQSLAVQLNGIDHAITPAYAQKIIDMRHALRKQERAARRQGISSRGVPLDAFSVAFSWLPTTSKSKKVGHGVWDFRDNYVNGSAPDDFSSVSTSKGCSRIGTTTNLTYNYKGQQTANSAYLYSAGVSGSPISGVRDSTSGFAMLTDHGFTNVNVQNYSGCGEHTIGGEYRYEHNQDGGSVLSVSAGFGILSVSYNSVGSRLQRAAGPSYVSIG